MLAGAFAIIVSSILFGIIPTANKYVLLSGMTSGCMVTYMSFTMVMGTAVFIFMKRIPIQTGFLEVVQMMLLGTVGLGLTDFFLAQAYHRLPVGMVTMLHFLYPSLVIIVMTVLFHEKLNLFKAGALVLSFFGLFCISDLSGNVSLSGLFYAIASAFAYAFYFIGNDRGKISEYPLIVKMFFASLGAFLLFAAKTILSAEFSIPSKLSVSLLLFGVVGIGSLIGFYLITVGIKFMGAEKAGFFNMLEPVLSLVVSVLVYKDVLSKRTWLGCALILLSVLVISLDSGKKE